MELSAKRASGGGIAMEFTITAYDDYDDENSNSYGSVSPSRIPRRLRRRLVDVESNSKSQRTVEDIEAKLRDADLRRQVRCFSCFLIIYKPSLALKFSPCGTCLMIMEGLQKMSFFL